MRRKLHIVAAYTSADNDLTDDDLTDDDLVIINVRGEETKYISIEQRLANFASIPWVKGCGGIMHAYIFNVETRETKYLKQ